MATIAGLFFVCCAAYALFVEPRLMRVRRMELRPSRWPEAAGSLAVCQVSDPHLTEAQRPARRLAELVLAQGPSVVVLTGDLPRWDGHAGGARLLVSILAERVPVYLVPGNHDAPEELESYAGLGATVLVNRCELLREGVWMCGVDDPVDGDPDPTAAFGPVPEDAFAILLSHAPDVVYKRGWERADLVICGHTHCGQVHLPFVGPLVTLSDAPRRYRHGLLIEGGRAFYTSAGAGHVTRLRFLCRPEIAVFSIAAPHDVSLASAERVE